MPPRLSDDPSDYVEVITQRLQLTHQQMASPSPPTTANPYQEGSLIFAMTTPPEGANKLSSQWKGPIYVCRIVNDYQIVSLANNPCESCKTSKIHGP